MSKLDEKEYPFLGIHPMSLLPEMEAYWRIPEARNFFISSNSGLVRVC